jgi:signal peptidase I
MEPTLRPGDRVLVDPSAYRDAPPAPGDLVAAVDPADPGRWLVKRVARVGPDEMAVPVDGSADPVEWPRVPVPAGTVFLLSDALAVGRDGRRFGPLPFSSLRGRVWYRYAPAATRGRLDRPGARP